MMLHEIAGATLSEIENRISYTEGLHYQAQWWQKRNIATLARMISPGASIII